MDVTLNTIRHILPGNTVFRVWERLDEKRNKKTVYHCLFRLPKVLYSIKLD